MIPWSLALKRFKQDLKDQPPLQKQEMSPDVDFFEEFEVY